MSRVRAALASVGVALSVFTYLALPILRKWFGETVDLVVYAGIAVFAGAVTYALIRGVFDAEDEQKAAGQKALDEEMKKIEEGEEEPEAEEIEEMLEDL